ncbi:uncharacterized protein LOC117807626 isoform X2 [Xyrichtys novacula]|uniref:Uncharacterized protein LOC117807626 isoform X2 n=1 Tax=Xyrichtys novacula TaxID=13765 RepID=A0AAV1HIM1_XYRNO|nr:uncharacterized protein LOC117807626 isoform X2 [Xyrichtys novacula]
MKSSSETTRVKMVSRFLLLMALSVCVSGTLVVKVAHRSYQAEEDQDLTLEWTFTPKPDSSLKTLNIFCSMVNNQKDSVLFHLRKGVEVPQAQSKEFVGRVQCDKEVLREGRIRHHVSSLRTEDSGWYQCQVNTEYGNSLDRCDLNVTERTRTVGEPEPDRQTSGSRERISLYPGLTAAAAAAAPILVVFIGLIFYRNEERSQIIQAQENLLKLDNGWFYSFV